MDQLPREFLDALLSQGGPQPPMTAGEPALPPPGSTLIPPGAAPDPLLGQQDPSFLPLLAYLPEPVAPKPEREPVPMPGPEEIFALAERVYQQHQPLLQRMARDLAMYRQHEGGVPQAFDPDVDIRVASAAISNLVNKLANLLAGMDLFVEAPYRDDQTEQAAQAVENYCYYCLDARRYHYARQGGNDLLRDVAWYLLLYGRAVARVLPYPDGEEVKTSFALLDPATCFPLWGSVNEGLRVMIRRYQDTVERVLRLYADVAPDARERILRKLGYEELSPEVLEHKATVVEYWDADNRFLGFAGEPIFSARHNLGYVPFVYVMAVGEPQGMGTPEGQYAWASRNDRITVPVSAADDLAQKGVSVFHYLVNTHRLREALSTILYHEVEKMRRPATITYSAPHLAGKEPPPLDFRPGANNQRIKDLQQVEAIPTAPRPVDLGPLKQEVMEDWYTGTLNPAGMGMEMGANASGYALETLVANAKDLIVPYTKALEVFWMQVFDLELRQLRDVILPLGPLSYPARRDYGPVRTRYELTPDLIATTGTRLRVRLRALGPSELPRLAQTAMQMQSAGLWSQKAAMDYVGVRDPQRMLAEILVEKGMQHPMVMESLVIPEAFYQQGLLEYVQFWLDTVVLPKLMAAKMPGSVPGTQPPPGASAPAPVEANQGGIRQPGSPPAPPAGPIPGQGRE